MKKTTRAIALTAVAAIALTGCVRVEMNIDLQENDTVDGEMIFAFSQEMLALAGEDSLDELLNQEQEIDGAVTERYESDDTNDAGEPAFVGTRTTFTGQALSEFDAAGDDLSIVRDGEDYVVSGQPEDIDDQTGGQELPNDAQLALSITFPGEVSSHNGELDGNTVSWDLLTHTGAIEARGSATEGGGGFPLWLIIAIVALVGVGIGLAVVLVGASKRKGGGEDYPAVVPGPTGDFQGTVDMADAGAGTVVPPAEPVVETGSAVEADSVAEAEPVVDTSADEDPNRA